MSLIAVGMVSTWTGVTTTEIAIGFHLANCANAETGKCFPSIAYIAKKCSLDARSVQRNLSNMEAKGLIMRRYSHNSHGKQQTTQYIFKGDTSVTHIPDTSDTPHPDTSDTHKQEEVIKTKRKKVKKEKKEKWAQPEWINPASWDEFEQHRKTTKAKLTDLARTKAANLLKPLNHEQQQACIDASISAGWPGLYPDKHTGAANEKRGRTSTDRNEESAILYRQLYQEAVTRESGNAFMGETQNQVQGSMDEAGWH